MASGRTRVKQETARTQMELTKIGLRGKANDPISLPLSSSSSQGVFNMMETSSLENTEQDSHEYEDVKLCNPGFNILHKNNNTIYPKHRNLPAHIVKKKPNTSTECREDSNKESWALKIILGVILLVSFTSLILVVLNVIGIIGPKYVCNSDLENAKQGKDDLQPNASTTFLLKRIDMLEKNISSLVLQLKLKYGGNDGNDGGNGGNDGGNGVNGGNDGGNGGNGGSNGGSNGGNGGSNGGSLGNCGGNGDKENSTCSSNITNEVQKLREKQVQLDSSLTKLKNSDRTKNKVIQEMSAKLIGLAVVVNFLSLNDSMIKSKVHNLSNSEVEFRTSLEALKQKDAEVDTSLKRAKDVEVFLNTSVSHLKSVIGEIKKKVDELNTEFMTKINSINRTINGMPGVAGSPGPPGPQGPRGIPGTPGAGNLSQCQHQQKVTRGVSGVATEYFVNFIEPMDKIVVGATCSTIRGDETNLSTVTNSRGEKVYLCTCKGQSNFAGGSGDMKCLIDVWICPRVS